MDFGTSSVTVLLAVIGLAIPLKTPKKLSMKILLFITCMAAAVILWGFQAGIVSVLTVEVVDYPIKSLKVKIRERERERERERLELLVC